MQETPNVHVDVGLMVSMPKREREREVIDINNREANRQNSETLTIHVTHSTYEL